MAERWSDLHRRLHQQLLHQRDLLPEGEPLLLAVSGGQDSMALTGLLSDLRRLHHWPLQLWHGNHRWRPEAEQQAQELQSWAQGQGLPIQIDCWAQPQTDEASARAWRYGQLQTLAQELGCRRVVTGHTASDRSETVLLQLARGSHRRGLSSLRPRRTLGGSIELVRPLLGLTRSDTAQICRQLALPIWLDPSNSDPRFSRNRIRHEVLPVLEELHPGASGRISQLSERLAQEEEGCDQLLDLALTNLKSTTAQAQPALQRRPFTALARSNQRQLLNRWLAAQDISLGNAEQLEHLLNRLPPHRGPGQWDLSRGCSLQWNRDLIWLAHSQRSQPVQNDLNQGGSSATP